MSGNEPEYRVKDENEYHERIKYIFAALEACRLSDTPVGLRLERIMALYNQFYGKKHFTEIPITNEVEVLALIIDHLNIDRERLKTQAPTLSYYYDILKRTDLQFDTKPLYEFLEPELEKHLKRYLPDEK